MKCRYLLAGLLFSLCSGSLTAQAPQNLAQMKKDLEFLASEECQGRGLTTQGILKAGDYIAESFQKAGLKPANKDSYFQACKAYGDSKLGSPTTLTLTNGKTPLKIAYKTDYTPTLASTSGKMKSALAFVGYGLTIPEKKYDDYADIDVKGKTVVILRRSPRVDVTDPTQAFLTADHPGNTLASKIENAMSHGAKGVIFVSDLGTAGKNDALMETGRTSDTLAEGPVFHVKRSVVDQLLNSGKDSALTAIENAINKDLSPRSVPLDGWQIESEVTIERPIYPTRNVVGYLEGKGPLADETIVIGAHYDHLGLGDEGGTFTGGRDSGKIHYGADDNASGTTGLLELVRRYGAMKNRQGRRIVFIAFSGEEKGLFGSAHYCKEPLFPLEKTAFMINMDMIGRVTPVEDEKTKEKQDRIVVYGTGTTTGLDELVETVNKDFNFKMLKVEGGRGPSDHTSFYNKKVPVLFFFTGTHRDYHRPTDTADKINLPGLAKVADMVERFATHYAQVEKKPDWINVRGGSEDPTNPTPSVSRSNLPKLGIMPGNYGEEGKGVLIGGVSPGGAAEKGGLLEGDLIVEIAGKPVKDMLTYMSALGSQKAGAEIPVIVLRKDKKVTVKVVPQK